MSSESFPGSTRHPAGFGEVDPQALHANPGAARVIDVRNPHEFAAGCVPGSELLPMQAVPQAAQDWDRESAIVFVCHSGMRSGNVAHYLTQLGFRHVYNLRGGMVAWAGAGLPVER